MMVPELFRSSVFLLSGQGAGSVPAVAVWPELPDSVPIL